MEIENENSAEWHRIIFSVCVTRTSHSERAKGRKCKYRYWAHWKSHCILHLHKWERWSESCDAPIAEHTSRNRYRLRCGFNWLRLQSQSKPTGPHCHCVPLRCSQSQYSNRIDRSQFDAATRMQVKRIARNGIRLPRFFYFLASDGVLVGARSPASCFLGIK